MVKANIRWNVVMMAEDSLGMLLLLLSCAAVLEVLVPSQSRQRGQEYMFFCPVGLSVPQGLVLHRLILCSLGHRR